MAFDLSAADKVLKEFYLAPVREQLNNKTKTLAEFDKNTDDIAGKRAYVPIHVTRNSGVGARPDGGTLPSAGQQGYEDSLVPLKYNYARIKVTGPTIEATRNDEGAFLRAVSSEMKRGVEDLKRDLNRQVFGNGDSKIAQFGVTSSGDVLTLATATKASAIRQFEPGMKISIGTVAAPTTTASSLTVVSASVANKTVTVASGTGVVTAATDFAFRAGNAGANTSYELTGLAKQVDDANALFDVDPASYPVWVSTVKGNSGTNRQITEDLVQETLDDVDIASGSEPTLWIGSHGVVRSYANSLTTRSRFVNTVQLRGGWSGVEIAAADNAAFAKDRDCPNNTAYALSPDKFVEYRMTDYDWADTDGRVLRNVSGEDSWEAFLRIYHEIATSQRNAHAKIEDITE